MNLLYRKRKRQPSILRRYACVWASLSLVTRRTFAWSWNFGSSRSSSSSKNPTDLQLQLLDRAGQVRRKLGLRHPPSYCRNQNQLNQVLFVPSSYEKQQQNNNHSQHRRGFANWLIPSHVMVGQYPGQTPEIDGPSMEEVQQHLEYCVNKAGITGFCSLQSEIPSQRDDATWDKHQGMIFFEEPHIRRQFPRPFTHYAPIVRQLVLSSSTSTDSKAKEPIFLHQPIEDLNVPSSQEPLQRLLLELLGQILLQQDDNNDGAIYIHCWGGRGRAGLVGGCLLSLIWPTLSSDDVLSWIQTGYASRLGHDDMPSALSQSPQTATQRAFVQQFVQDYQQLYNNNNNHNN